MRAHYDLLGRWARSFSPDSDLEVQIYFDHTRRDYPTVFGETVNTFDISMTHRFKLADRHQIVWGFGYRSSKDEVENSPLISFLPASKNLRLANIFAQDSIALVRDKLTLTLGTKLEHNVYTGWEIQPSGRLAWKVDDQQLLWAAISRAVRTPSRVDRDFYVDLPYAVLKGGPNFRSESVVSYELGYRAQPSARLSLSLSTFYNVYKDLRSVEQIAGTPPTFILANKIEGKTYGAELWGEIRLTDSWRLKPGYAYLRTNFWALAWSTVVTGATSPGNDARHRFLLTSILNLTPHLELDGTLRHVSALPSPAVPAYWALDLHLGWRPSKGLEVALIGQNLLNHQHPEFGPPLGRSEIQHGVLLRVTWTF